MAIGTPGEASLTVQGQVVYVEPSLGLPVMFTEMPPDGFERSRVFVDWLGRPAKPSNWPQLGYRAPLAALGSASGIALAQRQPSG